MDAMVVKVVVAGVLGAHGIGHVLGWMPALGSGAVRRRRRAAAGCSRRHGRRGRRPRCWRSACSSCPTAGFIAAAIGLLLGQPWWRSVAVASAADVARGERPLPAGSAGRARPIGSVGGRTWLVLLRDPRRRLGRGRSRGLSASAPRTAPAQRTETLPIPPRTSISTRLAAVAKSGDSQPSPGGVPREADRVDVARAERDRRANPGRHAVRDAEADRRRAALGVDAGQAGRGRQRDAACRSRPCAGAARQGAGPTGRARASAAPGLDPQAEGHLRRHAHRPGVGRPVPGPARRRRRRGEPDPPGPAAALHLHAAGVRRRRRGGPDAAAPIRRWPAPKVTITSASAAPSRGIASRSGTGRRPARAAARPRSAAARSLASWTTMTGRRHGPGMNAPMMTRTPIAHEEEGHGDLGDARRSGPSERPTTPSKKRKPTRKITIADEERRQARRAGRRRAGRGGRRR